MSSSFTNQPSPHDPRHEESYPATPESGHEEADRPKLGSLTQKARGKQLNWARTIFFLVGGLTIAVNIFDIAQFRSNFQKGVEKEIQKQGGPAKVQIDRNVLQEEENKAFLLCSAIGGAFIFTGVVFLILGALVYRYPVPVTIVGLVLYLLTLGAGLLIAIAFGEPEGVAIYVSSGLIVRIFIIVGLSSSIKSALAYEKERRAEEEYGLSGEMS